MTHNVALPNGTVLVGDYRIERLLGAGGFGVTYLAEETPLARLVTIKEYFPLDFAARDQSDDVVPRSQAVEADYRWGLERFLEEAQTLARFNHPNIVRVYRYFRARKTGYIVLHFEEGKSFKAWLKGLGRAPRQHELDRIVAPLLDALEVIHAADFLHRDIAPDNIIIRTDGSPVLIDFGSARGDIAKQTKTLSALVKPGYSPYEQYATTSSAQGPWTDIYSLGATLYHAMTGKRPPDAPSRMVADDMVPVRDAALSSYRPSFLNGVEKALRLDVAERPRSIAAWRSLLLEPVPRPSRGAAGKPGAAAKVAEPRTGPDSAGPVASAARSEPPPFSRPQPVPQPPASRVKSRKRAGFRAPSRGGVVSAFLDGWRKAVPNDPLSPAASAGPAVVAKSAAAPPPVEPTPPNAAAVAPPAPEPGSRRPTPRAIRMRRPWRWVPIVAKLAAGAAVATAAVALQDKWPASVRSEGSSMILSGSGDPEQVGLLKGHRGAIGALHFSSDGRHVVSTAADATIRIWSAADRLLVRTIELDNGAATSLAVHDKRAATGHRDGTIALWDLETGSRIATFRRNEAAIASVAFLGDSGRVVASSHDWVLAFWDERTPAQPIQVIEGHEGPAQAVAFSARSGQIASAGADKTVKLWRAEGGQLLRAYRGHGDTITALAFSPDGRRLASAGQDGQLRVWSTLSSRLHLTLRIHQQRVNALAFSPDGETLASASDDGAVRLWNIRQARSLHTHHSKAGEMRAVSFAPDGRRIAAGGADGLVRLYHAGSSRSGI